MNKAALTHYLGVWKEEILLNIKVLNFVTTILFCTINFPPELILLINWFYLECKLNELRNPMISCGNGHTFLLKERVLYSCGDNNYRQLGSLIFKYRNVFTKVIDDDELFSISCGGSHTMLNTYKGVYSCGDNSFGQLGLKNKKDEGPFHRVRGLPKNIIIKSVKCGDNHTVVLTSHGLYGCGSNKNGELGLVNKKTFPRFTKIELVIPSSYISISCGGLYTMVLTDTGLWASGANVSFQLGLGYDSEKYIYSFAPVIIKGLNCSSIINVYCGWDHTILLTTDGLWSTGNNDKGQLGRNSTDNDVFTKMVFEDYSSVISVICQYETTLVLTKKGLFRWGNYSYSLYEKLDLSYISKKLIITNIVGNLYSTFLLTKDGIYSSGCNENGELSLVNNDKMIDKFKLVTIK